MRTEYNYTKNGELFTSRCNSLKRINLRLKVMMTKNKKKKSRKENKQANEAFQRIKHSKQVS